MTMAADGSSITESSSTENTIMSSVLGSQPALVLSGCVTVALLSAMFVVRREAKRRKKNTEMAAEPVVQGSKQGVIDKTKYPGGQITIYYATQTGTAESFAQQLEREGPDHGFSIHVVDMEETSLEQLLERKVFGDEDNNNNTKTSARAIVLAATYGEGEPTDNSTELAQICNENLLKDSGSDDVGNKNGGGQTKVDQETASSLLKGLEYCVFGLGNRQYEHYNAMGKFFDQAFEKLGGERIMDLGMGDDDADLEGDFETWKDLLWATLKNKYCKNATLPTKASSDEHELPDCEYAIEYHFAADALVETVSPESLAKEEHVHGSSRPYFSSFDCPVTAVNELRSTEDGGSTKHVEIDISKADLLEYTTADNLGVLALNDAQVVESVAQSLGYDLDTVFSLKAAPGHDWHGTPFPMPLTVRDCLTRYLDLTSAPRRSDLKLLTQYATDSLDRKALLRLSSKEGKQEYKEKIMKGYVGMVDLLKLCPSLKIPLEHFVNVCHFMLPRYYTIASSSSVHPQSVHLTVAVTQDQRRDGSVFNGVCSTHLSELTTIGNNSIVRIFNRSSTFRLPKDPSKPILMVGPGTGIAPMRALLQERQFQKQQLGKPVGTNVLYFGCKKRSLDYLYKEELQAWQQDGTLTRLYLAFSREQSKKVYVQHLLLEHAEDTWKLINDEQGSVYVCGGVKMGQDVMEALKEILVLQGQMSFDQAKDYLAKIASDGRFVQELWA